MPQKCLTNVHLFRVWHTYRYQSSILRILSHPFLLPTQDAKFPLREGKKSFCFPFPASVSSWSTWPLSNHFGYVRARVQICDENFIPSLSKSIPLGFFLLHLHLKNSIFCLRGFHRHLLLFSPSIPSLPTYSSSPLHHIDIRGLRI